MGDKVKCAYCGEIIERKDSWICVKTKKIVCRNCVPQDISLGPARWDGIKERTKIVLDLGRLE